MALALLWIEHLAFVLLLLAASHAWLAERGRRWQRTLVIALVAGLPLLAHGWLAWLALDFRIGFGARHSPWLYATSLFVGNAMGVAWLWRRVRGASSWPIGSLAVAAALAFLLDATTFWNLQIQARQTLASLRVEAGFEAFAVLPARPTDDENARDELLAALEQLDLEKDLIDDWYGEFELDDEDRAYLERSGPALERLHAAATLPRLQPEPSSKDFDWIAFPRVVDLVRAAYVVNAEARLRLERGDLEGAAQGLQTLLRLAHLQYDIPTIASTMVAALLRSEACSLASTVLSSEAWDAESLAALDLIDGTSAVTAMRRSLRMEEAYGLAMLGAAAQRPMDLRTLFGYEAQEAPSYGRLLGPLYLIFLLDAELEDYRQVYADYEGLATLGDVVAMDEADLLVKRRGIMTSLLLPHLRSSLMVAHRSDAEMGLLRAARAAAVERLRTGEYPVDATGLPGGDHMTLTRDGAAIVLADTKFPEEAHGGKPVTLRLD
jgi:hypothetical protein